MTTLAGRRVLVMGLGRFGGGLGCVHWLLKQGAEVTITDQRSAEELASSLEQLSTLTFQAHLGGHSHDDFAEADLVVVNPAVPQPWLNPYLQTARQAGIPLTTEIDLLVRRLDRKHCIGVTGTAGKSTTASMVHHLLENSGARAVLGGNIGGSLLPSLDAIDATTWVVLELSSAQLYWLDHCSQWSPRIAGTTNVAPNHIDWHGDEEHYRACKDAIHKHQMDGDTWIDGTSLHPADCRLSVPGTHNRCNAALAIAIAQATKHDIDPDSLLRFRSLPHRLCPVGAWDPPRFIDDSKSTTPEATVLAVRSFPNPSCVHLIAGGYDKGVPLDQISSLAPELAGLYTIGATGDAIADLADCEVARCGTLEAAIREALPRMDADHLLLLSPGCASWDQFIDYRARGKAFADILGAQSQSDVGGSDQLSNRAAPL